MKEKSAFTEMIEFFQGKQTSLPGDPDYNAAICHRLVKAASAEEGSIWRLDANRHLRLVYSTDITQEQCAEFMLREGEGITGAAALARETIAVNDAWIHPCHDRRADERLDFRTRSMISAPVLFGDSLYGVINILNYTLGGSFPSEWKERLSTIGVIYGAALATVNRLSPDEGVQGIEVPKKAKDSAAPENKTTIIGISPAIQEGLGLCLKAGGTDMPILILGETGTGKELAARRIHEASSRAKGPFMTVNCAAVTETLLESELFGHAKGAFTGATHDRRGKFVAASGGTLFLDEVGDMILASQAKILRALEEKKVTPVGSEKALHYNARIIAATNHDLMEMVDTGKFRKDLYYRLCGIEIRMPPLRDRSEDIHLLAMYFFRKALAEQKKRDGRRQPLRLSRAARNLLMSFDWPGNVRQLEQAIYAAVAICEGDQIGPKDFPGWLQHALRLEKQVPIHHLQRAPAMDESIPTIEHDAPFNAAIMKYLDALDATKYPGTGRWNLSAASRMLNMPRKTFTYRLKKLALLK
jgi:transcriptional regulator with GAF, ATPase, and Fis domain